MKQVVAIPDRFGDRRIDKREAGRIPELQINHAQDNFCQVGALDLRQSIFRPVEKVLFAIESDTDSRSNTAASAFTLIAARPGNGANRHARGTGPEIVR